MKPPFIRRSRHPRHKERGITMALVAIAMVAIIAMAALSIDVITLYLAREEAQRNADAAAIAAARVLSVSGATGDPSNVQGSLLVIPWQAACALATQLAVAVANQNSIGGTAANTVTVTFLYNGTSAGDCSSVSGGTGFSINPQVQVQVIRTGLPTFFSRIWRTGPNRVSATATAEAFNSSNSGSLPGGTLVPVSPRCVKPWIIANKDPGNGGATFVSPADGSITNPGIQFPSGTGAGVIGESFALGLSPQCAPDCTHQEGFTVPQNAYVPALLATTPSPTAVPACASGSDYQSAIGGCDQATVYACGANTPVTQVDLTMNPGGPSGDTSTATQCLIHQAGGRDILDTGFYPYRINAGLGNPVVNSGAVTTSSSIVSIPIYDNSVLPLNVSQPPVVIVGFLQAFINQVNNDGSFNVTVLNVAGCSNSATATPITGTSPVPIRLITPQ